MWKELGLDSVKKGFDSFVKKAVDRVDGDRREILVFPARDELGYLVSYTLREAPDQIGCNLEIESDDASIFRVPVTDRPLTVGDIKSYFPIKATQCVFRFKLEDDLYSHVFLEGLRDSDIAPTYKGGYCLSVLLVPCIVRDVVSVSETSRVKEPLPNREELVRQREQAQAAQVRAAREFAAYNALEEANKRKEKMSAQNQLGAVLDKWALTEQGKFKDVRSLLSTMGSVLWDNSGWVDVPMGELMISVAAVKKTYRKAIVLCHPDRHQKESAEQQYRADRIFNAINESYKMFTS